MINLHGKNLKKLPPLLVNRKAKSISCVGDGNDMRFSYIDDFIEAMLLAFSSFHNHDIINIASGKPISIKDIIYKILEFSNHKDVELVLIKPNLQ